jgi:D-glycero-D-manno-heptose 1,7-bisphosphate phosphatase
VTRPAVFLDRDGVLVETLVEGGQALAPLSLADFRLTEGVADAVRRLRQAGLLPIVFTNQPDIARGRLAPEVLEAMHARLRAMVPVEDILVCPHDDGDACACRKPKPGMLETAARKWAIDLSRSFAVGDRWRDVEAGRAAGCYTILLSRSYSECLTADARVPDLATAVDVVLTRVARAG